MNVFESLGLDPKHRSTEKVVQKVKNFEEVPESKITYPLVAQVKKDGVYGMLVVNGDDAAFFGRTGKHLSSCDGFVFPALEDGVYIGEVCLPGKSLEVLSGIVNPNRTNKLDADVERYWLENREVWFHDYITIQEFVAGKSSQDYHHRFDILRDAGLPVIDCHLVFDELDADAFAKRCIEQGEEGAVFKHNVDWEAGHKGWRSMKRVRRIEYDLLCIGAEEGTGKYAGKVVNLIFRWKDGKTLKAMLGKGYTHEDAKRMWRNYHDTPEGLIYRVYGLQDSSKGKIRLPKVGELRIDKEVPDV